MAESNDFQHDLELVEWKKKLEELRNTDRRSLNNFLTKHRSPLAPRRSSDIGRSYSNERKELLTIQQQPDEQTWRSRRRSRREDDDNDKDKGDKDKDKEPVVENKEENLFRDRSPIKGKFAETRMKVINKLKSLEITNSSKPSPPAHPLLLHTPSLHSQMRASDEKMNTEKKEKMGENSKNEDKWLDIV